MVRVAVYSLSSCEGCISVIATTLHRFLNELRSFVDFEYFKIVLEPPLEAEALYVDIAFVEGVPATEEDKTALQLIRERSAKLVSLGTCASTGGLGYSSSRYIKERGASVEALEPLSTYVKVDYALTGCPVNPEEFAQTLLLLAKGFNPRPSDYSVCFDCPLKGRACLLNKGVVCLGPVAMGGCGAPCPQLNIPCHGCRGPALEADFDSFFKILEAKGLKHELAEDMLRKFMGKFAIEVKVK